MNKVILIGRLIKNGLKSYNMEYLYFLTDKQADIALKKVHKEVVSLLKVFKTNSKQ